MLEIMEELNGLENPKKAKVLSGFFKTGKGEYGEGDVFLGIPVPETRKVARRHLSLPLGDIQLLLDHEIHEYRLAGLLILVEKFRKGDEEEKTRIYGFYLKNSKKVNNWDLVDLSAERIIGPYIENRGKKILYHLARSKNVWERRIAILSTFHFIKNGKFDETIKIAGILVNDKHDLIHKAVGWMLREMGKRGGLKEEEAFLKKFHRKMPRTMLRYAIERFDEKKKKSYMT